jgi:hypothetical protein
VSQASLLAPPPAEQRHELRSGDYYCTRRDLYRVEEVHGDFALIEDCRNEIVLDIAVSEVLAMERVQPAPTA